MNCLRKIRAKSYDLHYFTKILEFKILSLTILDRENLINIFPPSKFEFLANVSKEAKKINKGMSS